MEASAKSVLILGASGTGKTFYAKAIAGNSSLPAFVINGKEADFHTEEFEHMACLLVAKEGIPRKNIVFPSYSALGSIECVYESSYCILCMNKIFR